MDDLEDIQATLASVRQLAKAIPREPERLPQWPKGARGAPAAVLRSALFGMVERGKRKHIEKKVVLASWKGDEIRYTGWQLDQADLDCWLQILHLAKEQDLGEVIDFTGRQFLRGINRNPTGNAHRWLRRSIERLQLCGVNISLASEVEYQGPLVFEFAQDKATGHYAVRLNSKVAALFDEAFVKINYNRRKLLRSDLSRWLQGYVQSHRATAKDPHRIGMARLRELSGSRVAELWKFKQQLKRALGELEEAGVLKSFELAPRGMVVEWVRPEQTSKGVE